MFSIPPYRIFAKSSINSAALSWKSAVVTAGGSVSDTRLTLVSNLITALQGGNDVWSKLGQFNIYAAENTQSGLTDLVGLSIVTPHGSTFTTDQGYTTTGISGSYIDTGYIPSDTLLNNFAFGFWVRDNPPSQDSVQMGSSNLETETGGNECSLTCAWDDDNMYFSVNDINQDTGGARAADASKMWTASRLSSSFATAYHNDSSFRTESSTVSLVPNMSFYLGAMHVEGTGFDAHNVGDQFAASWVCTAGLDSTDVSEFYSALQTYMTAIGA